jgi:hypothetical protein
VPKHSAVLTPHANPPAPHTHILYMRVLVWFDCAHCLPHCVCFAPDVCAAQVPRLVSVVDKHLARWAAAPGAVGGYQALRLLTFDIIIKVRVAAPGCVEGVLV